MGMPVNAHYHRQLLKSGDDEFAGGVGCAGRTLGATAVTGLAEYGQVYSQKSTNG